VEREYKAAGTGEEFRYHERIKSLINLYSPFILSLITRPRNSSVKEKGKKNRGGGETTIPQGK
jgi:hypothetical protein